jgi:4-amino-4-deoxy-L-arabinose transferase-like glycosyltransferase
MMALPFIIAILGGISLIVVAILYFTNRRRAALKMLKVLGIVTILLIAFAWLTKSSLGL